LDKIKTEKRSIVNGKTLIATVDVGKQAMMGYWRCPDGSDIKPFEFSNHRQGFEAFYRKIYEAQKAYGLEEIVVGLESTGCYGEPLIHDLRKHGVRVIQVNPLHTKRVKDLEGNSPLKTDRKDPKVIADIIGLGHFLKVVIPEGPVPSCASDQARREPFRGEPLIISFRCWCFYLSRVLVMKGARTRSA
jgi:hypothetical protein